MGDNSIFSVFSNIWSSVRLKIPLNSKLLGDKDCLHWIWPVKKNDSLSFYLSIAVLLVYFYILLLLMPVSGSVLLLYAGAHKISLKYLFPEQMFIEVCCQKWQKCNTMCVTFFYWISRVVKKKRIKYIHQNLRYYESWVFSIAGYSRLRRPAIILFRPNFNRLVYWKPNESKSRQISSDSNWKKKTKMKISLLILMVI